MNATRRRKSRGQALTEFVLIVPPLLFLVLGTVDVSRAYYQAIDAAGASRAGARMGIISDTSDIGSAVRDEPNTGIANTVATWGAEGPGQAYDNCINATATCGDPNGCTAGSFSGSQIACFAVRTCNLSSGGDLGTCISFGPWGQRALDTGGHGLQVIVVIKFAPVTPVLPLFLGPGQSLYLKQVATGEELYF
jgi:TadE-like protein